LNYARTPAQSESYTPSSPTRAFDSSFPSEVSLYSFDADLTSPDFCASRRGPEGLRKTYSELFEAYPDVADHVTDYVVQGDRVAARFVAHSDAAALELHLTTFFTIQHGRIVSHTTYFDTKGRPCS
jgi:ketosteroid isomerase-like protein